VVQYTQLTREPPDTSSVLWRYWVYINTPMALLKCYHLPFLQRFPPACGNCTPYGLTTSFTAQHATTKDHQNTPTNMNIIITVMLAMAGAAQSAVTARGSYPSEQLCQGVAMEEKGESKQQFTLFPPLRLSVAPDCSRGPRRRLCFRAARQEITDSVDRVLPESTAHHLPEHGNVEPL
jgi:hypothetical protein